MRYSSLLSILGAVAVIGSPLIERDYVTDIYLVTITRTLTDTNGYPQTIPYNLEEYSGPSTQLPSTHHHGHKGHKGHKGPASSTSSCPPSSSPPPPPPPTSTTPANAVAPLPTTTSSSSVPPPPSNYVAPLPSTSSTVPPTYAAPSQNNHLAASSSTAPAPASSPTDNSYQGQVLYHHNVHRSNHSASPLEWDSGLEACAQALANKCVYQHDV